MIAITAIICLSVVSISGLVFLSVSAKARQKETMTKDICNTIEKMVIAVKGK